MRRVLVTVSIGGWAVMVVGVNGVIDIHARLMCVGRPDGLRVRIDAGPLFLVVFRYIRQQSIDRVADFAQDFKRDLQILQALFFFRLFLGGSGVPSGTGYRYVLYLIQ